MSVAVIGAGVSGLAALKWLRAEGLSVTAYEARDSVGGLWNLDSPSGPASTPAYPGLSMNTSRRVSGFSDFPYAGSGETYPDRQEVLDYLSAYAEASEITDCVRLRTRVESIVSQGDGTWIVTSHVDGAENKESFDKVAVCTGRHLFPNMPTQWDTSGFRGTILHSQEYASPEQFCGRRVLLVGTGASAADLAVQISKVSSKVLVSAKGGRWIIPRSIGGRPLDHRLSRLFYAMPGWIRTARMRAAIDAELKRLGIADGGSSLNLPVPGLDLAKIRLTLNTDFLLAVRNHAIGIRPEIDRIGEVDVHFTDGTSDTVDMIVFATGYQVRFPFLDLGGLMLKSGDFNLHKYVFPPDVQDLAFIGMVNVQGPFTPVYEMQARWMASVFSGNHALPCKEAMQREVARRQQELAEHGARPNLVGYLEYLNELAGLLGVRPRFARHPLLLGPLLFGPVRGSHFRLDGRHRWDSAASNL